MPLLRAPACPPAWMTLAAIAALSAPARAEPLRADHAPHTHHANQAAPAAAVMCASAVSRQLQNWHAAPPATPQPALVPGGTLRHWPTATLGVWVVEDTSPEHAVAILASPSTLTRVAWRAGCDADVTVRPRAPVTGAAFTDDDLARALATQARGVVYVWSPHMPLSVDGYRQLHEAATTRGVAVDVLLDPAADREFAAASLAAGGLPSTALRVADSVELQFREAGLHAPSLLAYRDGRMVDAVLRGYRTADEYGQYLDRELPRR